LIHRSFHSLQNSLPIIPEQKRVIESGSVASIVEHKRTNLSGINSILSDLEESVWWWSSYHLCLNLGPLLRSLNTNAQISQV